MITIITSLFNSEIYIETYLKYITLCKSYNKCEHLIFNIIPSNSINAINILNKYKKMYTNIQVIEIKEDIGLYNIWNLGIKKSKYDIIMNSNIDDILYISFLEEHYKYLQNNKNINLVCSIPCISLKIIKDNNINNYNIKWFNQKKMYYNKKNEKDFLFLTGIKEKDLYYEKYPTNIIEYLNNKKKFLYSKIKNLTYKWVSYDYFE